MIDFMELHSSVVEVQMPGVMLVSGLSRFPTLRASLYALGQTFTENLSSAASVLHSAFENHDVVEIIDVFSFSTSFMKSVF